MLKWRGFGLVVALAMMAGCGQIGLEAQVVGPTPAGATMTTAAGVTPPGGVTVLPTASGAPPITATAAASSVPAGSPTPAAADNTAAPAATETDGAGSAATATMPPAPAPSPTAVPAATAAATSTAAPTQAGGGLPVIHFGIGPQNVQAGQQANLQWSTDGAPAGAMVDISLMADDGARPTLNLWHGLPASGSLAVTLDMDPRGRYEFVLGPSFAADQPFYELPLRFPCPASFFFNLPANWRDIPALEPRPLPRVRARFPGRAGAALRRRANAVAPV